MQTHMAKQNQAIAIPITADGAPQPSGTQLAARPKTLGRETLPRSRGDVAVVVRAREIVEASGRILRTLHVFCLREARSLSREACAECVEHRGSIDGGAHIACGFSTREASGGAGPDTMTSLAARSPSGLAMGGIRCVRSDVPLAELPFPTHGGPVVVVVDRSGVPLGAVRSEVLRARPLIAHAQASDLMVPVLTVGEGEPLAKALGLMVTKRTRHACGVDDDQIATGVISDVTALQWLNRRRQVLADEG